MREYIAVRMVDGERPISGRFRSSNDLRAQEIVLFCAMGWQRTGANTLDLPEQYSGSDVIRALERQNCRLLTMVGDWMLYTC